MKHALVLAAALACCPSAGAQQAVPPDAAQLARAQSSPQPAPSLQLVSEFTGPMPTGVTVTRDNRIFLTFPRWADPVQFTCAELKDGRLIPYPNAAINKLDKDHPADTLVSVQSVVADPRGDRLWLVDPGNINFGANLKDAPKLLSVDLATGRVTQTVHFPDTVARAHSYLNDVRIDPRRGDAGFAYLTDSSKSSDNGLIVVDLSTGQSWRKLDKDTTTLPAPGFAPTLDGEADNPLMNREDPAHPKPLTIGSDGIAISPDGKTLYYRPLASHHLYAVPTDVLADRNARADSVSSAVKDLGDLGFASDGLACDAQGRLYLTDYEHHAVRRGDPAAQPPFRPDILVQDPRLIWPDTLSIGNDGTLYITSNQLNRQPPYHHGKDLRQPPYALFRLPTDARPIAPAAR